MVSRKNYEISGYSELKCNGGEDRFMEFHKKLQELRKHKGLTQEELAQVLFVSRTAISKWESGRGFPNIESLKAISKFFDVSVDELLSGEKILAIEEEEQKRKETNALDLVFGLLDCGMALLLILPVFGQTAGGVVQQVSLPVLTGVQAYMKAAYLGAVLALSVMGVLTLALQTCRLRIWLRSKRMVSLLLSIACVSLFIISGQPYGGMFTFAFLIIKVLMLFKK